MSHFGIPTMSPIFLLKNRILSLYDIIFVKNSNMDEQNNLKYLLTTVPLKFGKVL